MFLVIHVSSKHDQIFKPRAIMLPTLKGLNRYELTFPRRILEYLNLLATYITFASSVQVTCFKIFYKFRIYS